MCIYKSDGKKYLVISRVIVVVGTQVMHFLSSSHQTHVATQGRIVTKAHVATQAHDTAKTHEYHRGAIRYTGVN
jgi:hypothetical protein